MLSDSKFYMHMQHVGRRNTGQQVNHSRSLEKQQHFSNDNLKQNGENQRSIRNDRSFTGGRHLSFPSSPSNFRRPSQQMRDNSEFGISNSMSTLPRSVHVGKCGTSIRKSNPVHAQLHFFFIRTLA